MDPNIRTLRPETSKRGRPNIPRHPSSAGSSQKDLDTPIPKELGLLSLEGGMLGSENRKQESKMAVAKTRKGKAGKNRTKEGQRKVQGPEWGPQVEQTALLTNPIYIRQAQGREKHIKEEPIKGSLSLSLSLSHFPVCVCSFSPLPPPQSVRWSAPPLSSLRIFGLECPHTSRMDSPAIF